MNNYAEIEKIFGVKDCSASDIEGMERLYVSEHGDAGGQTDGITRQKWKLFPGNQS